MQNLPREKKNSKFLDGISCKKFSGNLKSATGKWPSFSQWKKIFTILSKKEKIYFLGFFILTLSSFLFLASNFYFENSEIVPAEGGTHLEGVVGQPRHINPIYATSNDVDRDLTELLFSGLMKYDSNGDIVPDLAQGFEIEPGEKVYNFYLKDNIFWSDGKEFSADDIIFTVKIIQNPDYESDLRTNWLGVEVEKISNKAVKFKLEKSYSGFLERLTLKIIPSHIWQDISPENFTKTYYNLQPVSCGPYKLEEINQDKKTGVVEVLSLETDPNYFGKKPYISEIVFYFFNREEELIKAAQQGIIKGFSLISSENNRFFNNYFSEHKFILPRYFAVFFNTDKSKIFKDQEVRQALNYATDKQKIIEEIGQAKKVDSPIMPEIYGYTPPSQIYQYDLEKAKENLDNAGFKYICSESEENCSLREKIVQKELAFQFKSRLAVGSNNQEVEELQKCLADQSIVGPEIYPEGKITAYFGQKTKEAVIRFQEKYREDILEPFGLEKGTGTVGKTTRNKLNELCFGDSQETIPLKFSLITVEDPTLQKVADLLKAQWEKAGAEVDIQTYSISQLQYDFIKPRNYDSLLFGEVLGAIPDPYPFWHSLQKADPGLNLASYENKDIDKLLEEARQSQDKELREEKLEKFQDLLIEDAPSIFLYSPDYIYLVSKEIQGIKKRVIVDPSKRFSGVEEWYKETQRAWK